MGNFTNLRRRRGLLALLLLLALAGIASAKKKPPAHPINLNTATFKQLQELPGVGPTTANAIIQFRDKSGPFKRPEDLLAIHGISQAKFEKMRPYVKVGAYAPRASAPAVKKTTP
jgi:competence ComEA-like helix-hairpin-helix protein